MSGRKRYRNVVLLLLAVAVLAGCSPATAPTAGSEIEPEPSQATERIIILHTNDIHGAVEPVSSGSKGESGGLLNLVSLIDQVRAEDPEHTLLLDAGDSFQGSYVSNSTQGEVVMAAMNIAGYGAWTLGNHEFDWGQEPLRARIEQAAFPALSANLLDSATGKTWDPVQPYTIIQVGQARVGILGLTYPDTPTINRAENVAGLDFLDAVESAQRYLPELEEQADLIVVLSHLGYDGDVALAELVSGIDVIVGGHSHVFLERPLKVGDTLIVQAGAKAQVLGRLELVVDLRSGEVKDYVARNALLPVTNDLAQTNAQVEELVNAALAEATETIQQPIGETEVSLRIQRAGEFALGNLVVDAMLSADIGGVPSDIAMHNNGGIRADLPKGSISFGQLYAVLPFENQLISIELSGAQVLRILEHSVSDRAGAMQVAGMAFEFRMSNPAGSRIREASVGNQPLDPERVYRVVTIDYLAAGGDGYETFLEGANPMYGDDAAWVVAEYIRTHSPVHPRVEGRIVQR